MQTTLKTLTFLGLATCATVVLVAVVTVSEPPAQRTTVIVQGSDLGSVADATRSVGGRVLRELGIIDAVAAELTPAQSTALEQDARVVRLHANRSVEASGKPEGSGKSQPYYLDTAFPTLIGADRLHAEGWTGRDVTVAVIDTGYWGFSELEKDGSGKSRLLEKHDARINSKGAFSWEDRAGHATHVSSVAVSSGRNADGKFNGVAPDANLLMVKAFDENGQGTYADVISAIDWVVSNKVNYGVRVLNLSFSAAPVSHYWDDPLNQAVMRAWKAGIVVVASAGNTGPDPMTIGVPGNVPYVITVGAMTDNYTPADDSDDRLASFSAAGPTVEGFVKPEVVAPGGHLLGLMEPSWATIAQQHPEFHDTWRGFRMSGTSQAAAVVSGVAALMLQYNPSLTPDDVKCKLMAGACPAVNSDGTLAYSVFQQGAGVIDAYDAVYSGANLCANQGLDVDLDLAGLLHFGGRANQDTDGNFYLMGMQGDGYTWSGAYLWGDGYVWGDAYLWGDGYVWGDAYLWGDGYVWGDAYLWSDAYLWGDGLSDTMSVNFWVPQE